MSTDPTPPTVVDHPAAARFEVAVDGLLAVAEYREGGGALMFTHTEVPTALEGRGLGSALIRAGLAAARERGLAVIPLCPFFDAYMRKHPETHDLLHASYRTKFGLDAG